MALKQPSISETPDADYLMSDEIGLVIAKGMQVLYKTNPKNPVDFLAKYLLNTAKVQRETAAKAKIEEERNAALEEQRL
jgi:Dpy-30 motif